MNERRFPTWTGLPGSSRRPKGSPTSIEDQTGPAHGHKAAHAPRGAADDGAVDPLHELAVA